MASAVIFATRTVSGNQPVMRRLTEGVGETFLRGVPVFLASADGGLEEALTLDDNGAGDNTRALAGFNKEPGNNLVTVGVGVELSFGSVQHQTLAINIPRGAPLVDGRIGVEMAAADTVFSGQVGPAQTPVIADIGKTFGLTRDTDGSWYVDRTATGANQIVVTIVGLHPDDARGVFFTVLEAAAQMVA